MILILMLTPLILLGNIYAQQSIDVEGVVINKKTNEPVIFCVVHIKEIEKWTTTDINGKFALKDIRPEIYTIETECLGFVKYSLTFDLNNYQGKPLKLQIVPTSFDMKEVTILAKRGKDVNTSTNLSTAAIEHVQPTTLGDIMQLMPGNIATNPDLSKPQQLSIREIGNDKNSAIGTAIIIDGAPISNDGNLQGISTANGTGYSATGLASTVAGGGIDLRSIPTENIESVEIIKGIPSVIYGDLTSGAVIIKTKAGKTPLNLKLKTDPKIKQFAVGQGFNLAKSNSSVNYDFDYLKSDRDLRSKYKSFERLTGTLAWSKTFFTGNNPLSFNVKYSFFKTIDESTTDPDAMADDESYKSTETGHRFNINGQWQLNKKLITNLNYSFSFSAKHQENFETRYRSASGLQALSLAQTEGENLGIYLPSEQLTEMTIDGRPMSIFGQITARKVNDFGNKTLNTFLYGFDFKYTHNSGDGQLYDQTNPPYVSSSTARPRSFDDIPAMKTVSFYFEDKFAFPIGKTRLTLQAGARINNFQASSLFKSDLGAYVEPRANMSYQLRADKRNKFVSDFSINFGIGRTYKAPSLLYLYPDMAYKDLKVLDWYQGDPETNMVVFYSKMFDTSNPDLKPSENLKKEVGIDFTIGGISGNVTAFDENLSNGFGFERHFEQIDYYTYETSEIPVGTLPNLPTLTKNNKSYLVSYQTPVNIKRSEKKGIEFDLRLGKIKSLYTSFSIDGAWLKTTRTVSTDDSYYLPSSGNSTQYEFIGVYAAGETKISERFNTNLRMVTHIPSLRLMVSTTLQMIWFDKYYYPFYDDVPTYLVNAAGETKPFTPEMRNDPLYVRYVTEKNDLYWETENMSPLFMANIRISKEISDNMRLSLYVNNFTNYRPRYKYVRSTSYVRRNSPIYFGAELRIKI